MEIISSELKNLRSSGGGGCAPGSNRSRWGRREKSDAGHQCEGAEFKALDNNITPYCNTNITRLDINRYFIMIRVVHGPWSGIHGPKPVRPGPKNFENSSTEPDQDQKNYNRKD